MCSGQALSVRTLPTSCAVRKRSWAHWPTYSEKCPARLSSIPGAGNRQKRQLSPSETERIAETLDVKPEEVREMEARLSGGDTPLEGPGSSDAEDDNPFAPIDWLSREEDEPEAALEERDRNRLTGEILRDALAALDDRSRRVVQARWLRTDTDGNPDPMTLQELAAELGVSAERVRQIEKKAIAKLRTELAADKDIL